MVLWSTQPLTEMSTRNIPGGKGRPARKAENLTAICEPTVYKLWGLDVAQPYGPSQPVTEIPTLLVHKCVWIRVTRTRVRRVLTQQTESFCFLAV
jgi:hypothetical protein